MSGQDKSCLPSSLREHRGAPAEAPQRLTLASDPRTSGRIALAKGYGALGAFVLVAFLSWSAGAPLYDTGLRALIAGVAGYLVAWSVAITVCRHVLLAQIRAARNAARAAVTVAPPERQ
jgi:hypothetical protein